MRRTRGLKRVVPTMAAVAASALLLASCSSGGDKSDADGGSDEGKEGEPPAGDCVMAESIDFMAPTYSDHTKNLWDEVIAGFEAEHPGTTVNLEMQSWENINEVVRTKIQSDQMPDILNIDSYAAFADDGMLYPAKDVMSEETYKDFQESFVKNASIGDTMYGIPLIASARALFYNKDIFEEAGVADAPKNWDEFKETAEKIAALDGGYYGYGMPLGNEEAQGELGIWLFGGGGGYGDAQELTIVSDENVEAVEFMKELIDAGVTQPDVGSTQRTPLGDVFFQGKIGMVVGLPPYVMMIEEKNPDLNYGIAPMPAKDGGRTTLGVADHMMAFDNGDDEKQCAIAGFMDYFYGEQYLNWVETEGFLPVTVSAGDKLKDNEALAPFIEVLPDAQFYPFTNPLWPDAQGAIQTLIGQIGQGKGAEEVLVEIRDKTL